MEGNVMMEFLVVMQGITAGLTREWPPELPPENQSQTEAFWMVACREEMRTRHTLSARIPALVAGRESPASLSPLEDWLLRRRVEWAVQLVDAASQRNTQTDVTLEWLADFALVRSWEETGCQGMWLHAERGGEPHPEAPGWLRDLQ